MNSFEQGFIKRAQEQGISVDQAQDLYKEAGLGDMLSGGYAQLKNWFRSLMGNQFNPNTTVLGPGGNPSFPKMARPSVQPQGPMVGPKAFDNARMIPSGRGFQPNPRLQQAGIGQPLNSPAQSQSMFKQGNEEMFNQLPQSYQMQHQQYMGMNPRREFSTTEQNLIDERKSSVLPKIFQSLKDSPAVKMYSPMTDAAWKGGLGALGGGALGAMAGGAFGDSDHSGTTGAILGALLGGGAAGTFGGLSRNAKNNDIEETMRHLPENATLRHYNADPLIQKNKDRDHDRTIAMIRAGLTR